MISRSLSLVFVTGALLSSLAACSAENGPDPAVVEGGPTGTAGTGVPTQTNGDDGTTARASSIRGDVFLSPGNELYPTFGESKLFDGYLVTTLANGKQYLSAEFFADGRALLAGDLSVNGNPVELGSDEVSYFSYRTDEEFPGVSFDGSAHTWTVTGGDGAPAFNASVSSPVVHPELTSPAASDTVPRTGFTVEWSGGSEDVLIELYQLDSGYNVVAALGRTARGGRAELGAADLAHLKPGKATLRVIRFTHETATAADGRRFKILSKVESGLHVLLE